MMLSVRYWQASNGSLHRDSSVEEVGAVDGRKKRGMLG
jgi:hypothetical protein